jgi:O-antigen ligase
MIAVSTYIFSILAPLIQEKGWQINSLERIVVRDPSLGSTSVEGRISFWQVAWKMIQERPLTGFGLGTYHVAYDSFRNPDHYWSMYTHNHYLQTWAETGIFSLISFVLFFILFFLKGLRANVCDVNWGRYWGIFAAALAFLCI